METGSIRGDFGGVRGAGRGFCIDQAVIVNLRDGVIIEAWEIADIAPLKSPGRGRVRS